MIKLAEKKKMPIPDLFKQWDQWKYTTRESRLLLRTTAIQKSRAGKQYKNANNNWHLQMQSRQLEPNGEAIYFILLHAQGLVFIFLFSYCHFAHEIFH